VVLRGPTSKGREGPGGDGGQGGGRGQGREGTPCFWVTPLKLNPR